jgi:hypothetical protein
MTLSKEEFEKRLKDACGDIRTEEIMKQIMYWHRSTRGVWAKDVLAELINKFPPDSSIKFRNGINWFCNEILKRMGKNK